MSVHSAAHKGSHQPSAHNFTILPWLRFKLNAGQAGHPPRPDHNYGRHPTRPTSRPRPPPRPVALTALP
eukprot:5930846-Amphidinium_carterae.1